LPEAAVKVQVLGWSNKLAFRFLQHAIAYSVCTQWAAGYTVRIKKKKWRRHLERVSEMWFRFCGCTSVDCKLAGHVCVL